MTETNKTLLTSLFFLLFWGIMMPIVVSGTVDRFRFFSGVGMAIGFMIISAPALLYKKSRATAFGVTLSIVSLIVAAGPLGIIGRH